MVSKNANSMCYTEVNIFSHGPSKVTLRAVKFKRNKGAVSELYGYMYMSHVQIILNLTLILWRAGLNKLIIEPSFLCSFQDCR